MSISTTSGKTPPLIERLEKIDPITGFPERILLGYSDVSAQSEHLSRYLFAAKYAKGTVLDIGAGTCYGSSIIAGRNSGHVIAADVDIEPLMYGKKVYDMNVELVRCNATSLPFRNETIDCVVSLETLEHIGEPDKALKEFFRVMNQTGRLIVSTPNKNVTDPILATSLNPYHHREYELKSMGRLLQKNGFKTAGIFFQSRISAISFLLRLAGVPIAHFMVRFKVSIVPIRDLLKHRSHLNNRVNDPDPKSYPINQYLSSFDGLSFFQILIIAMKSQL